MEDKRSGWILQLLSAAGAIILSPALLPVEADELEVNPPYRPGSAQTGEAEHLVNRSLELIHLNEDEKAAELLRRAIQIAPDLAPAHHNLGLALAKTGHMEEGIAELQAAISLDKRMAMSWLTLGGLYQSTGQVAKAIVAYEGFLDNFPDHEEVPKVSAMVAGFKKEFAGRLDNASSNYSDSLPAGDYFPAVFDATVGFWPPQRMPLTVFIASGEEKLGYRPEFGNLLKQSFRDWAHAGSGRVSFAFVDSADDALIVCSWIDCLKVLANPAEAGEARLWRDSKGLKKGVIKILTVPVYASLPLTDNRLKRTCLHEIGHVLGLAGHSTNPADIMFFSGVVSDNAPALTERDANTLIRLYALPRRD